MRKRAKKAKKRFFDYKIRSTQKTEIFTGKSSERKVASLCHKYTCKINPESLEPFLRNFEKTGEKSAKKRFFDDKIFLTEDKIFDYFFPESTHQAEYYAKNRSKISIKFAAGQFFKDFQGPKTEDF